MAKRKEGNPYTQRFFEHFPMEGDILIQVLRGHLLVEEVLRELLKLHMKNPGAIKGTSGASFDCHQVICLNDAFIDTPKKLSWVWNSAKKLNKLRNDLAHKIPTEALTHKVNDYIETTQKGFYIDSGFPVEKYDDDYPLLYDSILCLYVSVCLIKEQSNINVCT
ncbi:hypothetical protein A6E09_18380 [Aliivibrio fischeri]|nr:hypothetical protein A6E09_18380 [Aliivibrio fischeri]